jgi:L-lactate dehydrogenase
LRLLEKNLAIYRDIIPKIVSVAPQAVLVAVTDPPDPLADVAREIAGHDRVISTGTFLDSLRFRVHLGAHFGVDPVNVEAQVIGDHGTSQVFLWSTARIAGMPLAKVLQERRESLADLRAKVENDVRYANITIIEGHNASQYGIGIVSARIAEMVLRDERSAIPIGSYQQEFGVTLSLPSVVGRGGVTAILPPDLSAEEQDGLRKSAENLRAALERVKS